MVDSKDSYSKLEVPKKNLAHGKKIEPLLKACKKLDLSDRACFAENLGQIIKNLIRKKKSITLRKIFIKAFGNSADSLYKKRKSLITWPEEESIPENLRSKARDYLLIIEAITEFESEFTSGTADIIKQRLILALISQSSFNDNRNTGDRLFEESRSHYKKQINRLVNKIVEACDLDYQFHFSENHLPSLSNNISKMGLNSSAPRVKIADIFLKKDIEEYARIKIDSKTAGSDIETEIRKKIIEEGMGIPLQENFEDDWEVEKIPWEVFSDWGDGFWSLKSHTDGYWEYYIPSDLFLEIRYDPVLYRWVGVLVWDCEDRDEFNLNTYSIPYSGAKKDHDIFFTDGGYSLRARHIRSPDDKEEYMLYWHHCYDPFPRGLFEESGGFRGKQMYDYDQIYENQKFKFIVSASLDDIDEFALSNDKDSDFEVIPCEKLRDSEKSYDSFNKYTPAPNGTFAHIILHNLAYAPVDRRIDTYLMKDAKKKYAEFEGREKVITDEYFSKINEPG